MRCVQPVAGSTARDRNPGSSVTYAVENLLDLRPAWAGAFDLVVEVCTVQSVNRSPSTGRPGR